MSASLASKLIENRPQTAQNLPLKKLALMSPYHPNFRPSGDNEIV